MTVTKLFICVRPVPPVALHRSIASIEKKTDGTNRSCNPWL